MISETSNFLSSFPQVIESEVFVAICAVFAFLLLFFTFCSAVDTTFYCIRMHFYEKAILAAKDCDKLVVRPPLRLWKKFSVSEVSENAENTPRK